MDVTCKDNGHLVIEAHPNEAACLAGRDGFADRPALQAELEDKIADAWYAADCPTTNGKEG